MDVVPTTEDITTLSAASLTETEIDPTLIQPQPQPNATIRNHQKKEIKHVPTVWEKLIEKYDYDTANSNKANECEQSRPLIDSLM